MNSRPTPTQLNYMPTLVGFIANKLILNSSNFRREIVGLERINDVYTSRTEDAEFFQELIINGETHRTITGYLSQVPSASERYSNMLVESVESTNETGGITRFNVTYVGLFRDLQPKPVISYQPVDTYAFNPFSITVEFVESIGEVGSIEEINFLKNYSRRKNFPKQINGYTMPVSFISPFAGAVNTKIFQVIQDSPFFRPPLEQYLSLNALRQTLDRNKQSIANQGFGFPFDGDVPSPIVEYRGFVIEGISYRRYGKYAHAIISASDSAYFSYIVRSGGASSVVTNTLNFEF